MLPTGGIALRLAPASVFVLLLASASPALAGWPVNGIVVATDLYSRLGGSVYAVPDGGHGILVHAHLWQATSRVDPEGAVLWSVNPFAAAGLPEPTLYTLIPYATAADGSGGVWFASQDVDRNLVAMHIDPAGRLQGGIVLLCESLGDELFAHAAVADGAGGVFAVWSRQSANKEVAIHATRVDATGSVIGPAGGVVVFPGPFRNFMGAAPDGMGGLLVMTSEAGATVQRLDAALAPKFGDGAFVAAPAFAAISLAAAGDGGALVAWPEEGTAGRVRLQRFDASGRLAPGWPAAGVIAAMPARDPGQVQVIADGTGGACVAWVEQGSPVREVRASRVLANGQVARGWRPAVLAGGGLEPSLGGLGPGQAPPVGSRSLVADGRGGCYLAWPDVAFERGEVYAQHLAADGRIFPGWPEGGIRLGSEWRNNERLVAIADGVGGIYVAWDEYQYPMRLRRVRLTRLPPGGEANGSPPPPSLSLARVAPNPASDLFTVSATMPDGRPARLEVFDLAGRVSHVREIRGVGEQGLILDGSRLTPGVHWLRLTHPTGVRSARIAIVH